MSKPDIKVMAVSNVYCRLMYFKNKGDVEQGHKHHYDHATLISSGSVLVEIYTDEVLESSRIFKAPTMAYIQKDKKHTLTALEDNAVCVCIHAMRTIDEEIVAPEFLLEPLDNISIGKIDNLAQEKYGAALLAVVVKEHNDK